MNIETLTEPAAGCHIRRAVRTAEAPCLPYPYWLPCDILPAPLLPALRALPFPAPAIEDTLGKRETHNSQRIFVSEENRARYPVLDALAEAFQDGATVALLEDMCGARLDGTFARIEYCLDGPGFSLEPHDSPHFQIAPKVLAKTGTSASIAANRSASGSRRFSGMVGMRSYSMQP